MFFFFSSKMNLFVITALFCSPYQQFCVILKLILEHDVYQGSDSHIDP